MSASLVADLAGVIAPIFIVAGLGFGWARLGFAFDTDFVTRLVFNIGAPCLVFSVLSTLAIPTAAFEAMAVVALSAYGLFVVLAMAVLTAARLPLRVYLGPLSFPNTGNMGLPLSLFAFAEAGLAHGIVFYVVGTALQFTAGLTVTSGNLSLRRLARIPVLHASVLGIGFMYLGRPPPAWLHNTTELIGNLTIPLMLIALGVSLANLRVASLSRSLALAACRLGGGLAVGLALSAVFGLEGTARGITIIQCAMPVAVFNYLLAARYDRRPEEVAGMVVLSTAVSFATLPLLLMIALG